MLRVAREIWLLSPIAQSKHQHHDSLSALELNKLLISIASENHDSTLLNWMHKCFKALSVIAPHSATWTIGDTEVDVPFSTKALLVDILAGVWTKNNMAAVCQKFDLMPFDPTFLHRGYN